MIDLLQTIFLFYTYGGVIAIVTWLAIFDPNLEDLTDAEIITATVIGGPILWLLILARYIIEWIKS